MKTRTRKLTQTLFPMRKHCSLGSAHIAIATMWRCSLSPMPLDTHSVFRIWVDLPEIFFCTDTTDSTSNARVPRQTHHTTSIARSVAEVVSAEIPRRNAHPERDTVYYQFLSLLCADVRRTTLATVQNPCSSADV